MDPEMYKDDRVRSRSVNKPILGDPLMSMQVWMSAIINDDDDGRDSDDEHGGTKRGSMVDIYKRRSILGRQNSLMKESVNSYATMSEATSMQDDLYMLEDIKDEWKNKTSFQRKVYGILTFQFLSITTYIGILAY